MTAILVTGATGFVGHALCKHLIEAGYTIRAAVRDTQGAEALPPSWAPVVVGEIGPTTDWADAVRDIHVVIHLAARVHVMKESEADSPAVYRRVNTEGATRLAREAARFGVKRLLFTSSIKVLGESTGDAAGATPRGPFTEADTPAPQDAYAQSKQEAEEQLAGIAPDTDMGITILRLPLVYGPGVGGNFIKLFRLVERGFPLPFGDAHNKRSLLGLGNLVDLLTRCATHDAAPGKTFLVSDGEDVSTADLVRRIAFALDKPGRLWPIPEVLIRGACRLAGRMEQYHRLWGSLQIDSSLVRQTLEWEPPISMQEELTRMAAWWRDRHESR